jgi:phosphoserine phosphatase
LLVVFDLDETLVMAHTVDSLGQRIRRVNAAK